MQGEEEYQFSCPYCMSPISMLLEVNYDSQSYIEDCEVCCCPITISYTVVEGEVTSFDAQQTG